MDTKTDKPWQDTPDVSARIVTAIGRIASVMRSGMWEFATAENLNPTQAEMLQLLQGRTQGVRLSWLASQLSISAASASDSVSALVAKGLLVKARAEDDGRATALFLTPEGAVMAARIGSALGFAEQAAAALPASQQAELLTGLFKLISQLQKTERFPEMRACLSCRFFEPNRHPGKAAPHHCNLVDAPLSVPLLRMDCQEHQPAEPAAKARNWKVFA
ncbi:MarR family winged helix-turn-helix transcriptional regulator [Duganella callida]|uniref:MarR family transcriptional regulator n=1 Tax=Duganella callida TaxID=2561932 RepID=A0A4Y9S7E8_9BURK|nr:MarR family winged helix-turn-helix transcriptional regulator [Duganella callida]TFW15647.1 MarR family transcriptional regulator [Duganella callida]